MLANSITIKLKARGLIPEKYIGKGAFGNVYTCRKHFGRKKYAAKVVEFGDDNKIKWQTENEIEILKEVSNHGNIVRLNGVVRDNQNISIILEYIPGSGFLEGIMNWPRFDENDAKKVMKQLLDALRFCHSKRIIHRDVCPQNLLWYDVPTVRRPHTKPMLKLIDFNLSRKLPEHLNYIRADALGNPSYMAPECLQEEPITNFGTDIWSVGVLLFLTLGGYPPFFNDNYNHLLQNIIEGNYVFPPELWDHVSQEGIELVKRILQIDVNTRPNTDQLICDKWFQTSTLPIRRKSRYLVWPGQLRMKGFLRNLNERKNTKLHRKYSLVRRERKPFTPEDKMLELPSDVTESNFYQQNITDAIKKKTGIDLNSLDDNNNNNINEIEDKSQCWNW